MRILIIDFAYQNINRTVMLWQLAWLQVGDVTFFGPGHVSDEEWQQGLAFFLRRKGSFDIIVAAELLISALSNQSRADLLRAVDSTYECPFNIASAMDACQRNYDDFLSADAVLVVSMLEFDCYNMSASHRERLDNASFYVVGWGQDFIKPISELPNLGEEKFGGRANDRWWEFVTQNPHRIISSPAMVAENEFYWSNLAARKDRWAVQGARYFKRQIARKSLSDASIPHVGRALVNLISIINRINPRIMRLPFFRSTLNHFWEQGFRSSRYAYTCGSALGYPIRKYFEIPASGAVLVAEPCNGFAALGFRGGINAIEAQPEDLSGITKWLQSNPKKAQELASAGRDLVWDNHRVGVRAKQYKKVIETIFEKNYYGSRWDNGEFIVIGKQEAKATSDS